MMLENHLNPRVKHLPSHFNSKFIQCIAFICIIISSYISFSETLYSILLHTHVHRVIPFFVIACPNHLMVSYSLLSSVSWSHVSLNFSLRQTFSEHSFYWATSLQMNVWWCCIVYFYTYYFSLLSNIQIMLS